MRAPSTRARTAAGQAPSTSGYEDGKRVRKHVLGRTRGEVADRLDALLRAKKERLPIPDQRAKLGEFLGTWLEEVARPTIRASTHDSYRDIVELHLVPGLGRIAIAKLTLPMSRPSSTGSTSPGCHRGGSRCSTPCCDGR